MQNWYVVHTQPHAESRAKWHLENQGFETYLPVFLKERRHARRRDFIRAPLFPRYLFLSMDIGATPWRAVASTIGVIDFIRAGDRPGPVPPGIVEDIMSREGPDGLIRRESLATVKPGDRVRIFGGALDDRLGAICSLDDQQRVTLLLDILGREVKVRVPRASVSVVG